LDEFQSLSKAAIEKNGFAIRSASTINDVPQLRDVRRPSRPAPEAPALNGKRPAMCGAIKGEANSTVLCAPAQPSYSHSASHARPIGKVTP